MSDVHILYDGNDMILEVSALKNEVTGGFLNAATVTVSLADTDGNPVDGNAWPLALGYVTDSDGIYRVTLADTLVLTPDTRYLAEVIADAGSGLRAKWVEDCICRTRR
jgi:hypothetical protein